MSTNFKKRIYIFIVLLSALIVFFILLVQLSGPRIRNTALTQESNKQRLVITFNTDIETIDEITIKPSIPFTYNHDTFQLFVNFDKPLKYNTSYTVFLQTTDTRNKSSLQEAKFSTINPNFYYLSRSEVGNDSIVRANIDSNEEKTMYQSESILLYDFTSNSMMIVQKENGTQNTIIVMDNRPQSLSIPDGHNIDSLDASAVLNKYLLTLLDTNTYKKSVWEYSVPDQRLSPVLDDQSRQIIGSEALYAPDGKSIFYTNETRSLVLLSSDSSQPPINIGSFDAINTILPNEKGVYGLKNNSLITILSADGSEMVAPDSVQNASLSQQLNSLVDYVYIEQRLDSNRLHLNQELISLIDSKLNLLRVSPNKERLILKTLLSPNDEFVLTEEAVQPVIYDGIYPNGKPKNGFTNITDVKTGTVVKSIQGYDVKWDL
jgi:hypothetical protein